LQGRKKMFKKINIEEKLAKSLENKGDQERLLKEVYEILEADVKHDAAIYNQIARKENLLTNAFNFNLLETNKIYHLKQIKKICIDYRLRFLASAYFKGSIPDAAISKIKQLEKAHQIQLKGFKIIAPSKLFRLEDKDDPLLFAPIGNDYYYLIHKWGNDLHPLRKLMMWPFKSIVNLALVVFGLSYLITLLVPEGLFSKQSSSAEFWIIFFFMFKSIAAVVIFYGFALGKNFNPAIWNNKYLKT